VLEDSGQPWRIAVNVQSNTGSHVAFWVVDPPVGHPVLPSLPGRAQGFTTLAGKAGQALDYVKAPLFDFALGRVLPPSGGASADDLQDLLARFSSNAGPPVARSSRSGRSSSRTCTSRSTSSSATPTACMGSTTST
jgi:uncharacterized protein YukJ